MNGGTREKAKQVLESKFDGVSNIVNSDIGLTVYAKNGSFLVLKSSEPLMMRA